MASKQELNEALLTAVKNGDVHGVKASLDKGADVKMHDNEIQLTPLHWAAEKGATEIGKLLLQKRANPNASENKFKVSPLHLAAAKGDSKMVELLLEYMADPNATDDKGRNSLHFATSKGNAILFLPAERERIDYFEKIKVFFRRAYQRVAGLQEPPLQTEESNESTPTVKLLLQYGANPNEVDHVGNTALHYACIEGNVDIIQYLLAQGADASIVNADGKSPLDSCQDANRDVIINLFVEYNPRKVLEKVFGWAVENFDDEQVFEKTDYGFQVMIPSSSVKEGKEVDMKVRVALPEKSDITIPENINLVSCFYNVETSETFTNPINFCLQHNVEIKSQKDSEQLVFLRAVGPPPYNFEEVGDQVFKPNDNSGVVPITDSSVLVAIGSRSPELVCSFRYTMTLFFKVMKESLWQVKAVITKDLGPFNERVKMEKCFNDWNKREPVSFYFNPDVKEITMLIANEFYIIKPLGRLRVTKEDIDDSVPDSALLYLHFNIKLNVTTQELPDLELTFNGMRDEKTIVIASYELENKRGQSFKPPGMESTSPEISSELLCKAPKMNHLMTLLSKIRFKWEEIGGQLEISEHELENAKMENGLQNNTQKLAYMLRKWNDTKSCEYSWRKIISVVEEPPVENKNIADEIRQFLARPITQHEYIPQDTSGTSPTTFIIPQPVPPKQATEKHCQEERIQCQDKLKLEVNDHTNGHQHLKSISSEIPAHVEHCQNEQSNTIKKTEEKEEMKEKFEKLKKHWEDLQNAPMNVEVITDIVDNLKLFYISYDQLVTKTNTLLKKLQEYSSSTTTIEGSKEKRVELESLVQEQRSLQSQSDALISDYDHLLEYDLLSDKTHFQSDIDFLRDQLKNCKLLKDKKSKDLMHITNRLQTLELSKSDFEIWLTSTENKEKNLSSSLVKNGIKMTEMLKVQALKVKEDITEHKTSLDLIGNFVVSLSIYINESHSQELEAHFAIMKFRYHVVDFTVQAYVMEVQLKSRAGDLHSLQGAAVQKLPLVNQINSTNKIHDQLDCYQSFIEELKSHFVFRQHAGRSDANFSRAKMSMISQDYSKLKSLTKMRLVKLKLFLQRVESFECSLEKLEENISKWEVLQHSLDPPTPSPSLLQSQIVNIETIQSMISNHKPDFQTLVVECQDICSGPEDEETYLDELKKLVITSSCLIEEETRQGQPELQCRLDKNKKRLQKLSQFFSERLLKVTALCDNLKKFVGLTDELETWLHEQRCAVADLSIKDPTCKVLQEKLATFQSLQNDVKQNTFKTNLLAKLYQTIASDISSDDTELSVLKIKLEEVQRKWSDLSAQIASAPATLKPSIKFAMSYENGKKELTSWMEEALDDLTSLESIPCQPEAILEQKMKLENTKTKYNDLAAVLAQCNKDGFQLAKFIQDCTYRDHLTADIVDLHKKWDDIGNKLSENFEKINSSLMQTQEFQQVATSIEGWVNTTQNTLKHLQPIAARVGLIESQLEGLKPIQEDIKLNYTSFEQAKELGKKVAFKATTEEKSKIEARLHALELNFIEVNKSCENRMKNLQSTLRSATDYEDKSSHLFEWLKKMDENLLSWPAKQISSKELKDLEKRAEDFNQLVLSYQHKIEEMSTSESTLFSVDISVLLDYKISSPKPQRKGSQRYKENVLQGSSSSQHSHLDPTMSSVIHGQVLIRPGSEEAIKIGTKIRQRYEKLKTDAKCMQDDVVVQLETVLTYESSYYDCFEWLEETLSKFKEIGPLQPSYIVLKTQQDVVERLQVELQNKQSTLDSITVKGKSLMDSCCHNESHDEVKKALEQLNYKWKDLLRKLSEKSDQLAQGVKLSMKYEAQESDFNSWLMSCKENHVLKCDLTSDFEQILQDLTNFEAEVSSKKQHLDTTIKYGQDLESFVSCNNLETIASATVGYAKLQDCYDDLVKQLDNKKSELEQNISKVKDLRKQIKSQVDKLEHLKCLLDNHEPPHLSPEQVKWQLQHLEKTSSEWVELQSPLEKLLKSVEDFANHGNDIEIKACELSSCNKTVKTLLDLWMDKLQAVLKAATQFNEDYEKFSQWITGTQLKLNALEDVVASVDGVKKQIMETEALKSEIIQHHQSLQQLLKHGREMMSEASPEDHAKTSDCLANAQINYDIMKKQVSSHMKTLNNGLKSSEDFLKSYNEAIQKIEVFSTDIDTIPATGTNIETVKRQLEHLKKFETELQKIKPIITACNTKGKHLKESCHRDPWVDTKIVEVDTKWKKLQSFCDSRKHELEIALLQVGQFQEALAELSEWIDEIMNVWREKETSVVSLEDLESLQNELEALQIEIVKKGLSVQSLQKMDIAGSNDGSSSEISKKLKEFNEKWESLNDLTNEKQNTLSTAIKQARTFHAKLKRIVDQLNKSEEQSIQDWTPHGLPETCQVDLEEHKKMMDEVLMKELMEELKTEAEALKSQGSASDQEIVGSLILEVENRMTDIIANMEEKQTQLEKAKVDADEFDKCHNTISDQLQQLDKQFHDHSVIQTDFESVKLQLQSYTTLMKQLDELKPRVKVVEARGMYLVENCTKEDGDNIKAKLMDFRAYYDVLHSNSLSQLSNIKEALLTHGQFEHAYNDLNGSLSKLWVQLQNPEPITGQLDHITDLLDKHQTLRKEISAFIINYESLTKVGRKLMESDVEDKKDLERKLTDLHQEKESVEKMSNDLQKKLEEAKKKLLQFESQVQPFKSWVNKVLLTLDDSEPIYGDVSIVNERMDNHKAFQEDLESHQKSIDAINASGRNIMENVLDNPSAIKDELDELNTMWEDVCNKSTLKLARLMEAMKKATDFSQGVQDILDWVKEMETSLEMMAPPTFNMTESQEQNKEQDTLKKKMLEKQLQYEEVLQAGLSLSQLAQPQADTIFQQLEQLKQNWAELKAKMNARSEQLASIMLEIHGLQDILKPLSLWLCEADGTMTSAESIPIGNDLKMVDQQLAKHKSFQEEIATHQPNIDALKQRRSSVSSQTDTTDVTGTIDQVHKQWQSLQKRSSEHYKRLQKEHERLEFIAVESSFNYQIWCKHFFAWMNERKLNAITLFRRFDTNDDKRLTKEEFMKGLKKDGFTSNPIELKIIADRSDRNKSGYIDLSDINALIKEQQSWKKPARHLSEAEKIAEEVTLQKSKCKCCPKFKAERVVGTNYKFGDSHIVRHLSMPGRTVIVRMGGGHQTLEKFLTSQDPCREPEAQTVTKSIDIKQVANSQQIDKSKTDQCSTSNTKIPRYIAIIPESFVSYQDKSKIPQPSTKIKMPSGR